MSIKIHRTIKCDGYKCKNTFENKGNFVDPRMAAQHNGWTVKYGCDYCSECTKTIELRKDFK